MRNANIREWSQEEVVAFNSEEFKAASRWVAGLAEVLDEKRVAHLAVAGVPYSNQPINTREFACGVLIGGMVVEAVFGIKLTMEEHYVQTLLEGAKVGVVTNGQEVIGGFPTLEEMVAYVDHHEFIAREWLESHPYPIVDVSTVH